MSREFNQAMEVFHCDNAARWRQLPLSRRHVKVRIADNIYVYLYERGEDGDDIHVQTQHVTIPSRWWDNWPSDATVKRLIHRTLMLARASITDLEA